MVPPLWKTLGQFLKKLNTQPASALLGVLSQRNADLCPHGTLPVNTEPQLYCRNAGNREHPDVLGGVSAWTVVQPQLGTLLPREKEQIPATRHDLGESPEN